MTTTCLLEDLVKVRQCGLGTISKATKDLLKRRRALRLNPTASHLERLANISCRTALQVQCKKSLKVQAVENFRSSTTKEKSEEVPQTSRLSCSAGTLLNEDGTRTS
ncbi:unnamed protein product [Strongylus vulgaris]|uniref:Uncharacterized protein n=1 Tax=Strongylus vulgaris TaxID=40348 RepID=A0A3P7K2J1_STRVU|nr:unnamed protein product [Strongylus vulgaris]